MTFIAPKSKLYASTAESPSKYYSNVNSLFVEFASFTHSLIRKCNTNRSGGTLAAYRCDKKHTHTLAGYLALPFNVVTRVWIAIVCAVSRDEQRGTNEIRRNCMFFISLTFIALRPKVNLSIFYYSSSSKWMVRKIICVAMLLKMHCLENWPTVLLPNKLSRLFKNPQFHFGIFFESKKKIFS